MKEITLAALKEAHKAHPSADGLRILGNGEIKSAVTIKASHVTPSAKAKIEAAGGKVELV
jgi:large subunit ribosomal protein L15